MDAGRELQLLMVRRQVKGAFEYGNIVSCHYSIIPPLQYSIADGGFNNVYLGNPGGSYENRSIL